MVRVLKSVLLSLAACQFVLAEDCETNCAAVGATTAVSLDPRASSTSEPEPTTLYVRTRGVKVRRTVSSIYETASASPITTHYKLRRELLGRRDGDLAGSATASSTTPLGPKSTCYVPEPEPQPLRRRDDEDYSNCLCIEYSGVGVNRKRDVFRRDDHPPLCEDLISSISSTLTSSESASPTEGSATASSTTPLGPKSTCYVPEPEPQPLRRRDNEDYSNCLCIEYSGVGVNRKRDVFRRDDHPPLCEDLISSISSTLTSSESASPTEGSATASSTTPLGPKSTCYVPEPEPLPLRRRDDEDYSNCLCIEYSGVGVNRKRDVFRRDDHPPLCEDLISSISSTLTSSESASPTEGSATASSTTPLGPKSTCYVPEPEPQPLRRRDDEDYSNCLCIEYSGVGVNRKRDVFRRDDHPPLCEDLISSISSTLTSSESASSTEGPRTSCTVYTEEKHGALVARGDLSNCLCTVVQPGGGQKKRDLELLPAVNLLRRDIPACPSSASVVPSSEPSPSSPSVSVSEPLSRSASASPSISSTFSEAPTCGIITTERAIYRRGVLVKMPVEISIPCTSSAAPASSVPVSESASELEPSSTMAGASSSDLTSHLASTNTSTTVLISDSSVAANNTFPPAGSSISIPAATPSSQPAPASTPSSKSSSTSNRSSIVISSANSPGSGRITVTTVVSAYTTTCTAPTSFTEGTNTYTVTAPTTITVSDCPCTRTYVRPENETTITTVVSSYTTYCPVPTTFTEGTKTFTVTAPTIITVTNCPCTRTTVVPIGLAPLPISSTESILGETSTTLPIAANFGVVRSIPIFWSLVSLVLLF